MVVVVDLMVMMEASEFASLIYDGEFKNDFLNYNDNNNNILPHSYTLINIHYLLSLH